MTTPKCLSILSLILTNFKSEKEFTTGEVKFSGQKYLTSEPLLEVDFVLDIRTLSSLIMISQTSCCFVRDEMCLTSCCNPMAAMLALLHLANTHCY